MRLVKHGYHWLRFWNIEDMHRLVDCWLLIDIISNCDTDSIINYEPGIAMNQKRIGEHYDTGSIDLYGEQKNTNTSWMINKYIWEYWANNKGKLMGQYQAYTWMGCGGCLKSYLCVEKSAGNPGFASAEATMWWTLPNTVWKQRPWQETRGVCCADSQKLLHHQCW